MSKKDIKIDGVLIPSPTDWKPSVMTLTTNGTRTGGGKMRFNEVAKKRTWEGSWKNLTETQLTTLVNAFEGKAFFTIECYDPLERAIVTKTFYKGDRKFDTPKHISESEIYNNIGLTFIEQ